MHDNLAFCRHLNQIKFFTKKSGQESEKFLWQYTNWERRHGQYSFDLRVEFSFCPVFLLEGRLVLTEDEVLNGDVLLFGINKMTTGNMTAFGGL